MMGSRGFQERSRGYGAVFVFAALTIVSLDIRLEATPQTGSALPAWRTGELRVVTGQPGSTVYINGVRHGVTGEEGVLELPRAQAGTYPVLIRTVGFLDWKGNVVISAGGTRTLRANLQPTSDQALIHFQRAQDLRYAGTHSEAVNEYEQALALRRSFHDARIGFARSLIRLNRYEEAEKQIRAAMENYGRPYAEAVTVLANLRRGQGMIEESINEYRRALRLARGVSPEARIGLAIALQEAGELDESIREYRAGIAQDMDTEPILYFLLGGALERAERNREAIQAYQRYLKLDPEGMYASAVESMIEILKEEP